MVPKLIWNKIVSLCMKLAQKIEEKLIHLGVCLVELKYLIENRFVFYFKTWWWIRTEEKSAHTVSAREKVEKGWIEQENTWKYETRQ